MDVIKIKFGLKQITPMIHFQSDKNATIRATELKPKLDRFILWWVGYENATITDKNLNLDYENKFLKKVAEEKCKNWMIDSSKSIALNYKMRIKVTGKNRDVKINYGNGVYIIKARANDNEHEDYKSSFYDGIEVNITCFDKKLADKIIELFPLLIDSTGFGLQQSKGYGNFKVSKIDDQNYTNNIEDNLKRLMKHFNKNNVLIYKLNIGNVKSYNYKKPLNVIVKFNRIIKSGINEKDIYIPSILMKEYFKLENKQHVINEKKAMKHKLNENGYNIENLKGIGHEDINSNFDMNNIYYTRGLLGFAQQYSFSLKTRENINKFPENKYPQKNGEIKENFFKSFDIIAKSNEKTISRFPSPLHYHIDSGKENIYIIVNNNILKKIQNPNNNVKIWFKERFYSNEKKLDKSNIRRDASYIEAKIPEQGLFDFEDFFEVVTDNLPKYELTALGDENNGRK